MDISSRKERIQSTTRVHLAILLLIVALQYTFASNSEFPIDQILNIANLDDEQLRLLQETYLCSVQSFQKCCSCTPECIMTGLCCIDYFWQAEFSEGSIEKYVEMFLSHTRQYQSLRCSPIVSDLKGVHTAMKVYMISRCPHDLPSPLERESCEDSSDEVIQYNRLPVVGDDGLLYKNRYCAFCNSVQSFETLNLSASCEERMKTSATSVLDAYSRCSFKLVNRARNPVNIITCDEDPYIFRSCPEEREYSLTCELCQAYGGVTHKAQFFKNFHCQKLLYPNEPFNFSMLSGCEAAFIIPSINNVISRMPKYSMFISFTPESHLHATQVGAFDSREPCLEPAVFDALAGKCVRPFCATGYEIRGIECVKSSPASKFMTRKPAADANGIGSLDESCLLAQANAFLELSVNPAENGSKQIQAIEQMLVGTSSNLALFQFVLSSPFGNASKAIWRLNSSSYNSLDFLRRLRDKVHTVIDIDFVIHLSSASNGVVTDYYKFNPRRAFHRGRTCLSYVEHEFVNVSSSCQLYVGENAYPPDEYVLIATISRSDLRVNVTAVTCSTFFTQLPCRMREVSDYVVSENMSVTEVESQKLYTFSEYTLLESGVGVCVRLPDNNVAWLSVIHDAERFTTVIGGALSMVAYMWTILTYALCRELRNVSGKNLICLCLMLLISDSLLLSTLIAIKHDRACQTVAVLMHWALLAAQMWTAIIAFDIWSTFQSTSLKRNVNRNQRFFVYCLFAWGIPTVVVGVASALDAVNKTFMGYGRFGICWIFSLKGRLATFILPFSLSLIYATVTLTYTIYRIAHHMNKSKQLLKKTGGEGYSLARMALKLVSLLGVIELLGLVQFASSSSILTILSAVFRLLYTILRSFRGFFIWILYVATARECSIYRWAPVCPRLSWSRYSRRSNSSYRTTGGKDQSTAISD